MIEGFEFNPIESKEKWKGLIGDAVDEIFADEYTAMENRLKLNHFLAKVAWRYMINPAKHQGAVTTLRESWSKILATPLPTMPEQVDNLILFLGDIRGNDVRMRNEACGSLLGSYSLHELDQVIKHVSDQGWATAHFDASVITWRELLIEGWRYYEELKKGKIDSKHAFMAMKFGNGKLRKILDKHFKPAVEQAGFDLRTLDENPKAGLIDNRMLVEIQTAAFVVADLSHDNRGAYFEAGYAMGLGKPVIFTCARKVWERGGIHFDTNHYFTIKWDMKSAQAAAEDLKNTIRATLPDKAKMQDG